jgi:hypothetical protein
VGCAGGFCNIGSFATDGSHLYFASGTSVKRRSVPTDPEDPMGAPDDTFYDETEFDSLNGSICLDGTNLFVGEDNGNIHRIDIVTGSVSLIEPDFALAP